MTRPHWRRLSRRAVLRLVTTAGAAAAVFMVPGIGRGTPAAAASARVADPASRLAALFVHRGSAARIGRRYLSDVPAEADPARLVAAVLASEPALLSALTAPTDAEPLRLLGQRRRRDFIEGETVRVQGWIMAKTEARLCALAALTPRPAA